MDCWLVTGGAGFVGSNFVRTALAETRSRLVILDKLTYAGSRDTLADVSSDPRVDFREGDIADTQLVASILRDHEPTAVVNFAAESHVDRSIDGPRNFVMTNVLGTFELLETVRKMLARRQEPSSTAFRFLHVSTDEVYGTLGSTGSFSEETAYAPNSPYAATKAAADHLVRAYARTFRLPALITNASNNYGPYQFPEKLIPLTILNALEGRPLPIYGDGLQIRDWLHVDDHARGILAALEKGRPGEQYNLGGGNELTNLSVVDRICRCLESLRPAAENAALVKAGRSSYEELKAHVADRSAHDRRYAVDASKARGQLGWSPKIDFESGLRETVRWYVEHRDWADAVQSKARYERERLGVIAPPAGS